MQYIKEVLISQKREVMPANWNRQFLELRAEVFRSKEELEAFEKRTYAYLSTLMNPESEIAGS